MKDVDLYIDTILECKKLLESAKDGIVTYDDDGSADHGDGIYVGRVEAYGNIIKYCATKLSQCRITP